MLSWLLPDLFLVLPRDSSGVFEASILSNPGPLPTLGVSGCVCAEADCSPNWRFLAGRFWAPGCCIYCLTICSGVPTTLCTVLFLITEKPCMVGIMASSSLNWSYLIIGTVLGGVLANPLPVGLPSTTKASCLLGIAPPRYLWGVCISCCCLSSIP